MNPSDVADAPSIHNGVDLLEYRDLNKKRLGPYDGRVAAHVSVGGTSCYITTNADYVPGLPPAGDELFLRQDMHWGPDDPTLWPHQYSETYCHLGAIPRRTGPHRDDIFIMWWDPGRRDFVCPRTGHTLTRGLGKLSGARISALSPPVHELLKRCEGYISSFDLPRRPVPLVPQLADSLRRGLDRLCSIPATFERMVLGVTNVQRTFLELYGLLDWITTYQPRMTDTSRLGGASDVDVIGVLTMDPLVAEQFHRARLPYWFIRPLSAFHEDNILRVVKPLDPAEYLQLAVVDGFSPIQGGPTLEHRIQNLHRGTSTLPWYKNPFASGHTSKAIEMPAPGPSTTPSAAGPSVRKSATVGASHDRPRPDHQNRNQDAHFQQRNKFAHFDTPYMAAAIPSWKAALAAVDTSLTPLCGLHPRNVYVFPEPALVIGSDARRDMYIHHYQLIRQALLYRMGDVDEPHDPVSAAEWRDALQGKLVVQGKHNSKSEKRTSTVERILGPALRACGINTLQGFPVPSADVPHTTPARSKEITWELAEMNFRFELCALDQQACGVDRHEDCEACFPGGLLAPDLKESRMGFAAMSSSERLPHLLRLARLMEDWTSRPRPDAVTLASQRKSEYWNSTAVHDLEESVARYYTQSFYHFFGRAAVVPLQLEHEVIAVSPAGEFDTERGDIGMDMNRESGDIAGK
ncbi:hypothetical protein K438DRAFT_1984879 [Mycena galopus ATCC 62051]|nr:hypothetical protein K438DRAFT_1984879 [Mycena galopus ATCC 62051]